MLNEHEIAKLRERARSALYAAWLSGNEAVKGLILYAHEMESRADALEGKATSPSATAPSFRQPTTINALPAEPERRNLRVPDFSREFANYNVPASHVEEKTRARDVSAA